AGRFPVGFALGKAWHDAGRTDDAFGYFSKANALRLETHPHKPDRLTRVVDRCIKAFTAENLATRCGGCDAPDPIFIASLPRAGSTPRVQIYSSHSLVDGTTELPDIPPLTVK